MKRASSCLLIAALLMACDAEESQELPSDTGSQDTSVGSDSGSDDIAQDTAPVPAVAPGPGDLLIEELYYSGAAEAGGADHYFSDQFIELVNTTSGPLDLSGVMVGDAYGSAGAINPGMEPNSFVSARPDEVVLCTVWRLPEGTRLEAGGRLVIAHDGTNHRPFSSIDLSGAAFEAYVEGSGRDDDHPTVDNLESVAFNGGFDWLMTVFGASVVVLSADAELGQETGEFGETLVVAQASAVLDGVEALMDADSSAFKRLPASVDAGLAWVSDTYTGESLHRKRLGEGWQDTDDSSADFEVGAPDPGRAPTPAGVFGEPVVELGTGVAGFVALTDGDPVELVAGLQGGWHLDVSVRFDGMGPDGVLLVYEAVDESASRISYVTQALLEERAVIEVASGGWERVGDRVVLDLIDATSLVGSTVVLRVTAELGGQTWSDERRVTVVDDEP